jgi:hypothetical protein
MRSLKAWLVSTLKSQIGDLLLSELVKKENFQPIAPVQRAPHLLPWIRLRQWSFHLLLFRQNRAIRKSDLGDLCRILSSSSCYQGCHLVVRFVTHKLIVFELVAT